MGGERPLTKHFTRTARETWREALELSRVNGKEDFGGDFQDGRSHQKAHPLRGAAPTGQLGDAGRRPHTFREGQLASLGMGEGKRQRQKGRQSFQDRGLRPAGNREGGHVCTLGNPTQAKATGAWEPQEGGEHGEGGVLKAKKARLPADQAAWPWLRALTQGQLLWESAQPLVTSQFQARQVLPKRPSVTEPPNNRAPFTPCLGRE